MVNGLKELIIIGITQNVLQLFAVFRNFAVSLNNYYVMWIQEF